MGIRDDFIVYDLDTGELDSGPLQEPRFDHAAAALSDGSVLIVGGRRTETDLVASAERLFVDAEDLSAIRVGTAVGRREATALPLDDGSVVIVGGVRGPDDTPAPEIERWDGDALRTLPNWDVLPGAAYAALTGARVAMVGGQRDGAWTTRIVLRLPDGTVTTLDDAMPAVRQPRAVGTPDGRLLVIGLEVEGTARVATVVDPGGSRSAAGPITSTRPLALPDRLIALADGSYALADATGVDLLRLDLGTSFDDPPDAIDPGQFGQREPLNLDVAGRWDVEPPPGAPRGPLFSTASSARLDVAQVRFDRLALELDVFGPLELLLTRDGQAPVVLSVDDSQIALGDCALARGGGGTVGVVREGESLILRADGQSTSCALNDRARIGVAVRVPRGSGVQRISAVR